MSKIQKIAMGCKPDPFKFKIISSEVVNGNTVVVANYGGKTFNGNKLMVLRGIHDVNNLQCLDPHFLDEEYAVIARFVPNEEGMEMARICAWCFNQENRRTTDE